MDVPFRFNEKEENPMIYCISKLNNFILFFIFNRIRRITSFYFYDFYLRASDHKIKRIRRKKFNLLFTQNWLKLNWIELKCTVECYLYIWCFPGCGTLDYWFVIVVPYNSTINSPSCCQKLDASYIQHALHLCKAHHFLRWAMIFLSFPVMLSESFDQFEWFEPNSFIHSFWLFLTAFCDTEECALNPIYFAVMRKAILPGVASMKTFQCTRATL